MSDVQLDCSISVTDTRGDEPGTIRRHIIACFSLDGTNDRPGLSGTFVGKLGGRMALTEIDDYRMGLQREDLVEAMRAVYETACGEDEDQFKPQRGVLCEYAMGDWRWVFQEIQNLQDEIAREQGEKHEQ